jgi:hypothetical protein
MHDKNVHTSCGVARLPGEWSQYSQWPTIPLGSCCSTTRRHRTPPPPPHQKKLCKMNKFRHYTECHQKNLTDELKPWQQLAILSVYAGKGATAGTLRSKFRSQRRCPRTPSFHFRLSVNVGHIAQLLASVYSRFTTIQLRPKQTSTSLKHNVGHSSFCAIYITTTKFSPLMAPLLQTKLKMRRQFHSNSTHVTTVHRNHHPAFGRVFTTSTGNTSVKIFAIGFRHFV